MCVRKTKQNEIKIRRKSHITAKKVTNSLLKCIRFDFVSFKTVKLNCEGEIDKKRIHENSKIQLKPARVLT